MHYAKKESVKKKQKKKYKPKAGQYSLEARLKHFGERGETAVSKELKQLIVYDVFEPLYAKKLSKEEKPKTLTSLIFLKEKQDGNVKARSCASGSVQREHLAKEEAAAPTVVLESVFVTATIDAKEKRKVVTIDIPGAFLHGDNQDYVIENEWIACGTHGENGPKNISEVRDGQEGEAGFIFMPAKKHDTA